MSHLKWFHGFMELLVFYVQNISDLQQADKNKILISPFAVLRWQTFSLDYIFILSNAQFQFPRIVFFKRYIRHSELCLLYARP